jgi:hypothetical protein
MYTMCTEFLLTLSGFLYRLAYEMLETPLRNESSVVLEVYATKLNITINFVAVLNICRL